MSTAPGVHESSQIGDDQTDRAEPRTGRVARQRRVLCMGKRGRHEAGPTGSIRFV